MSAKWTPKRLKSTPFTIPFETHELPSEVSSHTTVGNFTPSEHRVERRRTSSPTSYTYTISEWWWHNLDWIKWEVTDDSRVLYYEASSYSRDWRINSKRKGVYWRFSHHHTTPLDILKHDYDYILLDWDKNNATLNMETKIAVDIIYHVMKESSQTTSNHDQLTRLLAKIKNRIDLLEHNIDKVIEKLSTAMKTVTRSTIETVMSSCIHNLCQRIVIEHIWMIWLT